MRNASAGLIEAETRRLLSAVMQIFRIPQVCPARIRRHAPDWRSHIRSILSLPPDTTRLLSGVTCTQLTWSECPFKSTLHFPDSISQTRKVLSALADTASDPFGVTQTLKTHQMWPRRVWTHLPDSISQTWRTLSAKLAEMARRPSSIILMPLMWPVCIFKKCSHLRRWW